MWKWVKRRLRLVLRQWLLEDEQPPKAAAPPPPPPEPSAMSMSEIGQGNVQVGQSAGPVVVNQLTWHIQGLKDERVLIEEAELLLHTPWEFNTQRKATGLTATATATAPAPIQFTPRQAVDRKERRGSSGLTRYQFELLRLVNRSGRPQQMATWMARSFGTQHIGELDEQQCYRARRYCEAIIERGEIKNRFEMGA